MKTKKNKTNTKKYKQIEQKERDRKNAAKLNFVRTEKNDIQILNNKPK